MKWRVGEVWEDGEGGMIMGVRELDCVWVVMGLADGDGGVLAFVGGGGLIIPSIFISIFLHDLSFDALSQDPNC